MRLSCMNYMKTARLIFFKHGACLTINQVGAIINRTPGAIRNDIHAARFPIPARKEGKRWIVDYRDVAEYVDRKREEI